MREELGQEGRHIHHVVVVVVVVADRHHQHEKGAGIPLIVTAAMWSGRSKEVRRDDAVGVLDLVQIKDKGSSGAGRFSWTHVGVICDVRRHH